MSFRQGSQKAPVSGCSPQVPAVPLVDEHRVGSPACVVVSSGAARRGFTRWLLSSGGVPRLAVVRGGVVRSRIQGSHRESRSPGR